MSSRYMNYLRKNAKFVMVVMSIVCMITFVVGAALSDWANSARRSAMESERNPVAVTWVKGKVHDAELRMLRHRHQLAYQFLYTVIARTLERGGKPYIGGRQLTMETAQQGFDVGIPQDNSEETAVQTMVLAEEAKRMGIVVDKDAVKSYLRNVSTPELREGDWVEIATDLLSGTNSGVTVNQLFEHLAYEFRAQHVRALNMSGFYTQGVGLPIVPPAEAFDMFNRLNRKLTIEAYPVEVANFVSQVKGEPTNTEVQKLFDDGQYRDPDPNVDEPGFRKPHKLAFKYLKVSFEPFLEEAKKQITDAQIEEQYQKDIAAGMHKVLELPADKKEETPPTDKPSAEKKEEGTTGTDKPSDTPPGDKPVEKPTDKTEEKPAENTTEKATDEAAKPSGDKGGCETGEDPPANKPAEPNAEDPKRAETNKEGDKPEAAKPADGAAAAKTDATPALDAPTNAATATGEAAAKEQKFKPLSEVREDILKKLAQPIAEEARKKAMADVTTAITKYGKEARRYNDAKTLKKNKDLAPPAPLDLAPLAAKYNFPISETPLVDRFEVAKYEIGEKVQQIDMAALQMMRQIRMMSFADIAFAQDEPLFSPSEARSMESDVQYIYFRTAEEKAADVTLKDARPQVVEFWKRRKAFELALAEAQKLADKAKGAEKLADAVPDQSKLITPTPFSWMTTGGFGMGQPEMSPVAGIELAGREFMQGVFALVPGQAGVAPNQPHSRVYVVRAVSQEPDDERLRTQFSEMGFNQLVLMLANGDRQYAFIQTVRNIEDQYEVKWLRPPHFERRM